MNMCLVASLKWSGNRTHPSLRIPFSFSEHLRHVRAVLEALRQHKFFGKLSKCEFFKPKVEYVGHLVSGDRIEMPDKIKAVEDWPTPTNITELGGPVSVEITGLGRLDNPVVKV